MTDNEIIKTLERCSDGTGKGIIKATLDLINRKDEQIEALIAGQETLQKALNEKIEENADLSIKLEKLLDKYNAKNIEIVKLSHNIQAAKSEAVKEFAERFENELTKIEEFYIEEEHENFVSANKVISLLVSLVKEMVGDTE